MKVDTLNLHVEKSNEEGKAQIMKLKTGLNFFDILKNGSNVKVQKQSIPHVLDKPVGNEEDI